MKTIQHSCDIILRGHLDPPLLALIAEYAPHDVPVQVVLRDLVVDPATLEALLERAHALGVVVAQVRCVDPARETEVDTSTASADVGTRHRIGRPA